MRARIIASALTILMFGCAHPPHRQSATAPTPQERVSDHYSRSAVSTYELYNCSIDDHILMRTWLKSGEHFPMLCRKTSRGVYPIPQSVFTEQSAERWSLMCEPRVHDTYALMRLEVSRVGGDLFIAGRKLKPAAKLPLLSPPS